MREMRWTWRASPAVLIQTEAKAATTTTLATSNASVPAGISVTFTATVSRTDGMIPTGAVTFLDGTTNIGTAALSGTGAAVLTIATLPGGSHTITAQYAGDANNLTSTSGSVSQTCAAACDGDDNRGDIEPSRGGRAAAVDRNRGAKLAYRLGRRLYRNGYILRRHNRAWSGGGLDLRCCDPQRGHA